jgi:hypothetical protein
VQSYIEVVLPLIVTLIFWTAILIWLVIVGMARIHLWRVQRQRTDDFVRAAHANMDAVTLMIGEMAAYKATYEGMTPEVSEALYSARRKAAELP